MSYWKTCVEEAISEIGITATEEQIATLTEWIEGAHENYGMAHGHDCIPNPAETQRKESEHRYEKEIKQGQERERLLRKNIAERYHTDVWVSVRDGQVEIQRAR